MYSSTFEVSIVDVVWQGGLLTPEGLSVLLWSSGYQGSHRLGCGCCMGVLGFS